MNNRELLDNSIKLLENAYVPYSKCKVGATLLTANDSVYNGVNVENASFGATNCAERTAIFTAITQEKNLLIKKIAVATSLESPIMPCGICRQVILEFSNEETEIIVGDKDNFKVYTLNDIIPNSFSKSDLK